MNSVQVSGIIIKEPQVFNDGEGIRFILEIHYPSVRGNTPPCQTRIPCTTFDMTPEQREILLGKDYRNFRLEINGRLARTMVQESKSKAFFNIEVIADPNGLLLQKVN